MKNIKNRKIDWKKWIFIATIVIFNSFLLKFVIESFFEPVSQDNFFGEFIITRVNPIISLLLASYWVKKERQWINDEKEMEESILRKEVLRLETELTLTRNSLYNKDSEIRNLRKGNRT
jgi:hypothetical protein